MARMPDGWVVLVENDGKNTWVSETHELVLCKDCKHRDPEDKKCDCGDMTVQGLYFPRPDTWYCPNGERRDGDGKAD